MHYTATLYFNPVYLLRLLCNANMPIFCLLSGHAAVPTPGGRERRDPLTRAQYGATLGARLAALCFAAQCAAVRKHAEVLQFFRRGAAEHCAARSAAGPLFRFACS